MRINDDDRPKDGVAQGPTPGPESAGRVSDFWNDPAIKPQRSQWMKFETPGDVCGPGTIKDIVKRTFDANTEDERTVPELSFVEPDVPTLTAGAWALIRALMMLRASIGDVLVVEFVGTVGKSKMFKVSITRPDGETEVVDTRTFL